MFECNLVCVPGVFHAAHQLLRLDVVYHRVAGFRHLAREANVVAGQQRRRRRRLLLVIVGVALAFGVSEEKGVLK